MPPPPLAASGKSGRPAGVSYIPTLDGWRAVAITAVLLCHGLDQTRFPFAMPLGLTGVLLFFAISGFLITSRLIDERARTGSVSFRDFYLRRAFRILPPAMVFLAVIAVLGLFGVIPFSGVDLDKALFFVRNYTRLDLGNPASWYSVHFWSLSVEEHFYLIWPAVLVLMWARRWRWAAFSTAVALAIGTVLWRGADEKYQFVIRLFHVPWIAQNVGRTDYVADALLWGCALALWLGPQTASNPWKRRLPPGTTSLFVAALVVFIGFVAFGKSVSHGRDQVHLFMALLIGATVTDPASLPGRLLELPLLRWVGRYSYSLYLWQELFFHADSSPLWFQRFPVNLIFILLSAWVSYNYVEKPLVRLGHRLTRPAQQAHGSGLAPAETVPA